MKIRVRYGKKAPSELGQYAPHESCVEVEEDFPDGASLDSHAKALQAVCRRLVNEELGLEQPSAPTGATPQGELTQALERPDSGHDGGARPAVRAIGLKHMRDVLARFKQEHGEDKLRTRFAQAGLKRETTWSDVERSPEAQALLLMEFRNELSA